MTDAELTLILERVVGGLVALLLTVIGFAAVRWFNHVEGLQQSMDQLRDSITGLTDKFVTQTQHDRDMEALRAFGRRVNDTCTAEECPFVSRKELPNGRA